MPPKTPPEHGDYLNDSLNDDDFEAMKRAMRRKSERRTKAKTSDSEGDDSSSDEPTKKKHGGRSNGGRSSFRRSSSSRSLSRSSSKTSPDRSSFRRSSSSRTLSRTSSKSDPDLRASSYHSKSSSSSSSRSSRSSRISKTKSNDGDDLKASSYHTRSSSKSKKREKKSLQRRHTMSAMECDSFRGGRSTRTARPLEDIDEDKPAALVPPVLTRSTTEGSCNRKECRFVPRKTMSTDSGKSDESERSITERAATAQDESLQDVIDDIANQFSFHKYTFWRENEEVDDNSMKNECTMDREFWDDEPQDTSQVQRVPLHNRFGCAWNAKNKCTKRCVGYTLLCKLLVVALPLTLLGFHFLSGSDESSSSTSSSSLRGYAAAPQDVQFLHFQMVFFGHNHHIAHTTEDKQRSLREIQNLMCSVNEYIEDKGDAAGSPTTTIVNVNWIDSDTTMTFRFTTETKDVELVTEALLHQKKIRYQSDYNNPELLNFLKHHRIVDNEDGEPLLALGTRVSLQALTPERAKDLEEVRAGALKDIQCTNPTGGSRSL